MHVLDLMLKFCSDINEGYGIQLLFYFFVFVNVVASFFGQSFFSSVGQVLSRSFLAFECYGNVCKYVPEVI